jgi:predicted nucleic acid-binding protein
MGKVISNTSPLLYLYRIGALEWLPHLFGEIWLPDAVVSELREGKNKGYDVPDPGSCNWITVRNPSHMPSVWLAVDLGPGEIAAMSLALEQPGCILLLDDALARRTAHAAGLNVWGTLRILLESKKQGLTTEISPYVKRLEAAGLWLSDEISQRILKLAGEK